MTKKESLKLFEDRKVRTVWDSEKEEWYFSVIDVVAILTDSPDPKRYWSVLKSRIKKERCEPTTICSTLKLRAADGKMRLTDVADTEQLFRIIQSIPSPKAEPFKQWMAQVAKERIDEMYDPELAIDRGYEYYRKKGYGEKWIEQRMQGKEIRKALTDEWQRCGVKDNQFAFRQTFLPKNGLDLLQRNTKGIKD